MRLFPTLQVLSMVQEELTADLEKYNSNTLKAVVIDEEDQQQQKEYSDFRQAHEMDTSEEQAGAVEASNQPEQLSRSALFRDLESPLASPLDGGRFKFLRHQAGASPSRHVSNRYENASVTTPGADQPFLKQMIHSQEESSEMLQENDRGAELVHVQEHGRRHKSNAKSNAGFDGFDMLSQVPLKSSRGQHAQQRQRDSSVQDEEEQLQTTFDFTSAGAEDVKEAVERRRKKFEEVRQRKLAEMEARQAALEEKRRARHKMKEEEHQMLLQEQKRERDRKVAMMLAAREKGSKKQKPPIKPPPANSYSERYQLQLEAQVDPSSTRSRSRTPSSQHSEFQFDSYSAAGTEASPARTDSHVPHSARSKQDSEADDSPEKESKAAEKAHVRRKKKQVSWFTLTYL